ncbi:MAG: 1,4-alpha-glucan branching protein GlgB [Oscillospiraceae bacterium]
MKQMILSNEERNSFANGTWINGFSKFGAHRAEENGAEGYSFAVWAPGARSVRLAGSFNDWDIDKHVMHPTETDGVWHLFIPGVKQGDIYKYVVETQNGELIYKADPYAFYAQQPPETASRVFDISSYRWSDSLYMARRKRTQHMRRPLNIYEVHLGSWRRNEDGSYYTYRQLIDTLIPYAVSMGYTHLELMPVMEHPFDGSWGYQITGYYAPTSRYGTPEEFMEFVDCCHKAGLGVILDWVPGHFCRDAHGLAGFTGEKLYEKEDHAQWGTYKFDLGRGEVRSFLLSNAMFWLEVYHADGIRVDGVTSMLYLNFGIDDPQQKRYNINGTEEDLDAVEFVRRLNRLVGQQHPDVMMIAEESTAWPLVTYPPEDGGLGFHYKWDMGWMHDTLNYMKTDFPYRPSNHNLLTFSMMYAFNENFILALSHDEVVHGKCSLIGRMPGDYWRQFAGMRVLAMYQICHPGAKHNFMGSEIAQFIEWRYYEGLEWFLLDYEAHAKQQGFIKELNAVYKQEKALWQNSYSWGGFEWLDADDSAQSTLTFIRHGAKPADDLVVLLNFAPETYDEFRIGVPKKGVYKEIFNSDCQEFGGSGRVNSGYIKSENIPWHGKENSVVIKTPPIGGVILKRVGRKELAELKK